MATESQAPLAIDGGEPLRSTPYPAAPRYEPAADPMPVRALETEFAERLGLPASHVIAFGSHNHAWEAALEALRVERGGEVIVPALLGDRIASAARRAGLTAVPAEVETESATLAVRAMEPALSPRTALVGIVHLFGHPVASSDLPPAVRERGIAVVEDASEAVGASHRGIPAGRLGDVAVFAFGPGHALSGGATEGAGRGALVVAAEEQIADRVGQARFVIGATLEAEIAAVALSELRGLGEALEARRRAAWELTFALRGIRGLAAMYHGRWVRHAYDRYVIRLRGSVWKRPIEETVAAIRAEGIPCEAAAGTPPRLVHREPATLEALPGDERLQESRLAVATRLAGELVAIPLHGGLTARDIEDIAAVLRKVERWST